MSELTRWVMSIETQEHFIKWYGPDGPTAVCTYNKTILSHFYAYILEVLLYAEVKQYIHVKLINKCQPSVKM